MENKRPLFREVVERLGSEVNVFVLESMVQEVLDGVREYRDSALGEAMAESVAILYGQLSVHKVGFSPSEIIALAYEELGEVE